MDLLKEKDHKEGFHPRGEDKSRQRVSRNKRTWCKKQFLIDKDQR